MCFVNSENYIWNYKDMQQDLDDIACWIWEYSSIQNSANKEFEQPVYDM